MNHHGRMAEDEPTTGSAHARLGDVGNTSFVLAFAARSPEMPQAYWDKIRRQHHARGEPYGGDYDDPDDHKLAWHEWRAHQREARLTDGERAAKLEALGWGLDLYDAGRMSKATGLILI